MKKIISLVLSVVMIFAAFPFTAGASANDIVKYTVRGVFSQDGKYLDIVVLMDNNVKGLRSIDLVLDYNEELLTPISQYLQNGDLWSTEESAVSFKVFHDSGFLYEWERGTVKISCSSIDLDEVVFAESGTLCTMRFEVKNYDTVCGNTRPEDYGFDLKTNCFSEIWYHNPSAHYGNADGTQTLEYISFYCAVEVYDHLGIEVIPGIEPTCTSSGCTDSLKCNKCGELFVRPITIPVVDHVPYLWEVEKLPSLMEMGKLVSFCVHCGEGMEDRFRLPLDHYNVLINGYYYGYWRAGNEYNYSTLPLIYEKDTQTAMIYMGTLLEEMDAVSFDYSFNFIMPASDLNIWSFYGIHGDINLDERISAMDILSLLEDMKSGVVYPEHDLNLDGKVTAADKLALTQIIKGTFDYTPYE